MMVDVEFKRTPIIKKKTKLKLKNLVNSSNSKKCSIFIKKKKNNIHGYNINIFISVLCPEYHWFYTKQYYSLTITEVKTSNYVNTLGNKKKI